jgi:hypothetical protein
LIGDYNIKGKILVFPIQGTGKSNMTMENITITSKFTTTTVEKNGKMHAKLSKYKHNFEMER